MEKLGVKIDRSGLDYTAVHANSRAAASALAGGVSGLLRKNKVKVVKGRARLAGPGKVAVEGSYSSAKVAAAASMVSSISAAPCIALTNPAS